MRRLWRTAIWKADRKSILLALFLLLLARTAAADIDAREAALAEQLRCVVCQNQTLAESNAPLAADMRREIRTQLQAGHSDAQVLAFFEQRYGAFVRYTPPLRPSTWALWGLPFALALAGLGALALTLRRRSRSPAPQALDDAQRERARRLLDDEARP